jgi:L-lactate dehydrogenase complex protein LldG
MMASRDIILARIRRSLGVSGSDTTRLAAVADRLAHHRRGPIPARGQIDAEARTGLFIDRATAVMSTVVRVADRQAVPAAIADYLRERNLPAAVRSGDDPRLAALPWSDGAQIEIKRGASTGDDLVCVSQADAGVAETGTLVLTSGAGNPSTLNFLPDHHIVVVEAKDVAGDYESALDVIRARSPEGALPRTINFVTGPSRSADIEETLLLGAHGPRSLHIIVIG